MMMGDRQFVQRKRMPKHWYKKHVEECPLCGKSTEWTERICGEKPDDPAKRYTYKQQYDYCEEG